MSKRNKNIEREKNNFQYITRYLIDEFYLNPAKQYTVKSLMNELNLGNSYIGFSYFNALVEKQYMIPCGKNRYRLTFDGFEMLEEKNRKQSIYVTQLYGFAFSIFSIVFAFSSFVSIVLEKKDIVWVFIFLVFVIIAYLSKILYKRNNTYHKKKKTNKKLC